MHFDQFGWGVSRGYVNVLQGLIRDRFDVIRRAQTHFVLDLP
jgi:hypothetical protein